MRNTPSSIDELDILAITPSEEKILAAISVQARSITDIANLTRVARTSLLYILTKLYQRGLVERHQKGKRMFWKSSFHKTLEQLSNPRNRSTATTSVNYNHAQDGVVIHSGVPAIMKIFERLIEQPKGSRVYGIQPDNSIKYALRKVAAQDWTRINTTFKEKKFIFEGIVHEKSVTTIISEVGRKKAVDIFNSFIGRLQDYVKIPDEFANVEAEIYIFGGSAFIINWHEEIAIEVVDKHIVALLLAMFSCVKELGQRYSQNEKMKQYGDIIQKKSPPTPPNTPQ